MAVVARDAVPANDVVKMGLVNAAIDENLISIEIELHTLGSKLFGAFGGSENRMEPADGIPVIVTMRAILIGRRESTRCL